jgi:hypothetical protein
VRDAVTLGLAGTVVALAAAVPALGASPASAATSATGCTVADATMTWGFKESFRSYISGSIAKGSWTAADGATYATPSFGWSGGAGTTDASGVGTIGWTGSVWFTGHGGILDTTIADPAIEITGPTSAVLHLDVRGTTQDGAAIDEQDVPFATLDLAAHPVDPTAGTVEVDAAAATLTQEGATAFGTYPAGTALDPVSASVPVTCTDPTPTPSVTPVPAAAAHTSTASPVAASADPGSDGVGTALGIGAAALAAAAGATALVVVRRRRAADPSP